MFFNEKAMMSVCMGGGMWVWPVVTFYPGCGAQHRVLKINLNVNIAHQAMTRLLFLIFRPIKSGGASGVTSICCCWSYPKPDHSSSFPTAIYVLLIESKIRKCRQEKKNATSFFFFFFLRGKHCLWTHTINILCLLVWDKLQKHFWINKNGLFKVYLTKISSRS